MDSDLENIAHSEFSGSLPPLTPSVGESRQGSHGLGERETTPIPPIQTHTQTHTHPVTRSFNRSLASAINQSGPLGGSGEGSPEPEEIETTSVPPALPRPGPVTRSSNRTIASAINYSELLEDSGESSPEPEEIEPTSVPPPPPRPGPVTRSFNRTLASAISQSAPLGGPAPPVLFSMADEDDDVDLSDQTSDFSAPIVMESTAMEVDDQTEFYGNNVRLT